VTKIAIISDLHGNVAATEAVLREIDAVDPDITYCLGDLVGYGAFPNETIDLIRGRDIPTIMGNYDDGVGFDRDDCGCAYMDAGERERGQASLMWTRATVTTDRKAYLRTLPAELREDINGVRLRLVHGSPRRMNEYLFEDRDAASLARIARTADCDVLHFGHTHQPWSNVVEGVRMVNTGSVGKPKDGDPRAGWVLLTIDPGGVTADLRRVEYDIASMAAAIRAADGLPDHFATDIETAGQAAFAPPPRIER
jgi:putative phosphoesterase